MRQCYSFEARAGVLPFYVGTQHVDLSIVNCKEVEFICSATAHGLQHLPRPVCLQRFTFFPGLGNIQFRDYMGEQPLYCLVYIQVATNVLIDSKTLGVGSMYIR